MHGMISRQTLRPNLQVTAPYDGALLAELEQAGRDEIELYLENAYSLFRNRDSWLPLSERIGILERCSRIMLRERIPLAMTAAQEGGKPLLDSEIEVERAIDGLKLCVEHIRTEAGSVIPMGTTHASAHRIAFTQREPVGVVVAVSAFNHPLNLVVHQVAPAVAAGCPVIIKPSPDTPLSCLRFIDILREAGLPPQWVQVAITDDIEIAEALVTDPRVGFLSFIGSPAVGWMLRSKLAPGTRCALEHGGAAPVILFEDADIDLVLDKVTKGSFYHAGQVCVSVQRIFVPRDISRELAEKLATQASSLRVGDPRNSATQVGPLIRPAEVSRVNLWVREAQETGADIVCGGETIGHSLYKPTILFDPPSDAKVSQREIFGPVACVYPYETVDEAIFRANRIPFAFQASVFTQNLDAALRVYQKIDASAVMVNDHSAFRVDGMPFAGLKQSGLGVGGIPNTIDEMQIEKMAVIYSTNLPG